MNAIPCIGEQDKRLDENKYFWFALPATSCTIRAKQSITTEIFINIHNILDLKNITTEIFVNILNILDLKINLVKNT
jgi:hypothetical protein